ncbi:MAG TPA: CRTAC1 family protein [Anaerolineae bacterium]|nr:CRTAC1 family protein [Anaerolineae bacterium]
MSESDLGAPIDNDGVVVFDSSQIPGDQDGLGTARIIDEANSTIADNKVVDAIDLDDDEIFTEFELVPGTASGLKFREQTEAVGISKSFLTPIIEGDGRHMLAGAGVGDFNNDGWQDLLLLGGGVDGDGLFINNGDGTFRDETEAAGLELFHMGSGVAVGDYNGDGWQDIYVTSFGRAGEMGPGRQMLYRNNGDGTFTDVASEAGVNWTSREYADGLGAAFGDYDLDGDLDLFVAGWRKPRGEPALGNRLFRNNGDETFTDVTEMAGIEDDGIRGFSPCFADMDGDWYPELVLAADFGTSRYWRNNGDGTFQEWTLESGTDKTWSGMGSTVADMNGDGLLDWYITAIFDMESEGRGFGATLYLNRGGNKFEEVAAEAGVADVGWGWGTVAVDFDLDGLIDLAAVNGWPIDVYHNEAMKLWINQGDGTWAEEGEAAGLRTKRDELGLLNFDYDGDGDQDLVVTGYQRPFFLYRNELDNENHWLRVKLVTTGTGLAPDGWGSRVKVTVGGEEQYRVVTGCAHYLTQSELPVHFGLAEADKVDRLEVFWADGEVTVLEDVAVDQTLVIKR